MVAQASARGAAKILAIIQSRTKIPDMRIFALVLLLLHACGLAYAEAAFGKASDPRKQKVYFGTYTGKLSRGIYYAELDLKTGSLSQPILAGEITNPSFLALHPRDPLLSAVS